MKSRKYFFKIRNEIQRKYFFKIRNEIQRKYFFKQNQKKSVKE